MELQGKHTFSVTVRTWMAHAHVHLIIRTKDYLVRLDMVTRLPGSNLKVVNLVIVCY